MSFVPASGLCYSLAFLQFLDDHETHVQDLTTHSYQKVLHTPEANLVAFVILFLLVVVFSHMFLIWAMPL